MAVKRDIGHVRMDSSTPAPRKRNTRAWLIATGAGCALVLAVIVIATGGFGLISSDEPTSKERTAQDRCESEVLARLVSPSTAKLSSVKTARDVLDPDTRDLFALLDGPLKGVDHSRILVWTVSGVVDAQNELGAMIHDPFSCHAYFIDNELADTLVLFDHDH
jgi:hypothetical protein